MRDGSGGPTSAAPSERVASPWFRLYLPGPGPRSDAVERAVRTFGDRRYGSDGWTLDVVDVRADPEAARADGVLLSPTLHRLRPEPAHRWLGDLSDADVLDRTVPYDDV